MIEFEEADFTESGLDKCKEAIAGILGIGLDGQEIWLFPSPMMIADPSVPEGYFVDGKLVHPDA